MLSSVVIVCAAAAFTSAIATELYRRVALRRGLIDQPNERSSHTVPTPRGGGVAIVLASLAGFAGLWIAGFLSGAALAALVAGGVPVAAVGLIDDRRPVPARVRLTVHFAAALLALLILNHASGALDLRSSAGLAVFIVLLVGTVWSVNLFNFMDGIDGIAAAEAAFIALAGGGLAVLAGGSADSAAAALVFGGAVTGFLVWNWPPARIFMGDVGSGYLGLAVALFTVVAAVHRPTDFYAWLILSACFVADSMVTLITRFFRGETVSVAHRSHAYQRLSRHWRSHRRVTLAFVCINVLWLLPLAAVATFRPALGPYLASVAFVPLVTAAVLVGAGRADLVSK